MNGLLVNESGEYLNTEEQERPRLKVSIWLPRLTYVIRKHLEGLFRIVDDEKVILLETNLQIEQFANQLSQQITGILLNKKLLISYRTIAEKTNGGYKTASYFAWAGSNLLAFPKTLALPMVCPPNDWEMNFIGGANNGGYLLSSLTNISYQGYLDSKSSRVHEHSLHLKEISHLNNLQKVKFIVNERMVAFYNRYQKELTEGEILLLTDKWINPSENLVLTINHKWAGVFNSIDAVSNAISNDLISKKNETLRNQEILKIAQLYCNREVYWPVVQDFRGRIYRIGSLNIQLNTFVRSLIAFASDVPLIKRRKQSNKSWAQYNLLLREVLIKKDLIEKWDNVFGDRLINNDKFEALLLEDLLAKKLSLILIQVGQLLLIRQGAYDKVGIYKKKSSASFCFYTVGE